MRAPSESAPSTMSCLPVHLNSSPTTKTRALQSQPCRSDSLFQDAASALSASVINYKCHDLQLAVKALGTSGFSPCTVHRCQHPRLVDSSL